MPAASLFHPITATTSQSPKTYARHATLGYNCSAGAFVEPAADPDATGASVAAWAVDPSTFDSYRAFFDAPHDQDPTALAYPAPSPSNIYDAGPGSSDVAESSAAAAVAASLDYVPHILGFPTDAPTHFLQKSIDPDLADGTAQAAAGELQLPPRSPSPPPAPPPKVDAPPPTATTSAEAPAASTVVVTAAVTVTATAAGPNPAPAAAPQPDHRLTPPSPAAASRPPQRPRPQLPSIARAAAVPADLVVHGSRKRKKNGTVAPALTPPAAAMYAAVKDAVAPDRAGAAQQQQPPPLPALTGQLLSRAHFTAVCRYCSRRVAADPAYQVGKFSKGKCLNVSDPGHGSRWLSLRCKTCNKDVCTSAEIYKRHVCPPGFAVPSPGVFKPYKEHKRPKPNPAHGGQSGGTGGGDGASAGGGSSGGGGIIVEPSWVPKELRVPSGPTAPRPETSSAGADGRRLLEAAQEATVATESGLDMGWVEARGIYAALAAQPQIFLQRPETTVPAKEGTAEARWRAEEDCEPPALDEMTTGGGGRKSRRAGLHARQMRPRPSVATAAATATASAVPAAPGAAAGAPGVSADVANKSALPSPSLTDESAAATAAMTTVATASTTSTGTGFMATGPH
ncbi:hypothetical protein HK405_005453 [Cladochytrium tenue]|nr:hypothetical protein HK405_005453 [Cladochytrium tenue]